MTVRTLKEFLHQVGGRLKIVGGEEVCDRIEEVGERLGGEEVGARFDGEKVEDAWRSG